MTQRKFLGTAFSNICNWFGKMNFYPDSNFFSKKENEPAGA
jgi:hypothetical protein